MKNIVLDVLLWLSTGPEREDVPRDTYCNHTDNYYGDMTCVTVDREY